MKSRFKVSDVVSYEQHKRNMSWKEKVLRLTAPVKTCRSCGNDKSLFDFQVIGAAKLATFCKECREAMEPAPKAPVKDRISPQLRAFWNCPKYERVRRIMAAYLFSVKELSGCAECGHSNGLHLEFHHIDPKTKLFAIGCGANRTYAQIKAEIAKCVILCSHCHTDEHFAVDGTVHPLDKIPPEVMEAYCNTK